MRHSSIRSIVATLAIALALTTALPLAAASQAQSPRNTQSTRARDEGQDKSLFDGVRAVVKRALRRLGVNDGLTVPIPPPAP